MKSVGQYASAGQYASVYTSTYLHCEVKFYHLSISVTHISLYPFLRSAICDLTVIGLVQFIVNPKFDFELKNIFTDTDTARFGLYF